ncbi:MAG: hypothetical protein PVG14_01035 [Anaerolineales bacterium]|jgi:hypothetical protein
MKQQKIASIIFLVLAVTSCSPKGTPTPASTVAPPLISAAEKRDQHDKSGLAVDYWSVLTLPGMDDVQVGRVVIKSVGEDPNKVEWDLDIYYPPNFDFKSQLPAVLVVGANKEWKSIISTAQLIAASDMIAITYDAGMFRGTIGIHELINFIRENADHIRIDKDRICLWSNRDGPVHDQSLEPVLDTSQAYHPSIKCAVYLYAQMDTGGLELSSDVPPLLVVHGGMDNSIDRTSIEDFVDRAREMNVSIEYIVFEAAGQNFDFVHDTDETRTILQQTLDFFKDHLTD